MEDGEPSPGLGQVMIYCNRTVRTFLDLQSDYRSNMLLTINEWAGQPTLHFRQIPIRNSDQLLNTEARVV